jgi:hypothetical protein
VNLRSFYLRFAVLRGRGDVREFEVRVASRRFSLAMDLGSMSHWPLPGRPGCFCFEPTRRPRLRSRQISALVVFMAMAVCWAVSQLESRFGMA